MCSKCAIRSGRSVVYIFSNLWSLIGMKEDMLTFETRIDGMINFARDFEKTRDFPSSKSFLRDTMFGKQGHCILPKSEKHLIVSIQRQARSTITGKSRELS